MQAIDEIYTENDNTYVNISFTKIAGNTDRTIALNYNVTKTAPVLDDASKYYATVVKFDIPLSQLPTCICPIVPNQANSNLTPIQVGIRYLGVNYLESVIYVPQNLNPAPSQLGSTTQIVTPYYFMYSYDQMITMINTALRAAFIAAGLNAPGTGIANIAPYFVFEPETGLFSLIVNNSFNAPAGPQVIFNFALFQFLDNFDITQITAPVIGTNAIYAFVVFGLVNESFAYNYYGITPPATIAPPFPASAPPTFPVIPQPYFYKITQDSISVSTWNPVRKILFLTTALPITYEVTPAGTNTSNANGVYNSLNVLTDFTPQITDSKDSSSVAYFAASGYGGYRLADMVTNQPLYKIDVRVVWQDLANNIYDMVIDEFSQANIKLGFIRKSLYKHF